MRISDWSSDVCSSDLLGVLLSFGSIGWYDDWIKIVRRDPNGLKSRWKYALQSAAGLIAALVLFHTADATSNRSEERRVGKERVRTCRSRLPPYPSKTNIHKLTTQHHTKTY